MNKAIKITAGAAIVAMTGYWMLTAKQRRVTAFCDALAPGLKVEAIELAAKKYGIPAGELRADQDYPGNWFIFVSAGFGASVVESGCGIAHNGKTIKSAGMRSL
jgi:hypothetical protein